MKKELSSQEIQNLVLEAPLNQSARLGLALTPDGRIARETPIVDDGQLELLTETEQGGQRTLPLGS